MREKDKNYRGEPNPGQTELLSLLRSFDIAQPHDTVLDKLAEMRRGGEMPELWADFDNTLTARNYGIWEALRDTLPPAGRLESDAERHMNLAKERHGTLSIEENIAWTKHEIGRYTRYGVTVTDIMRAVESVRLRAGARRLFTFCDNAGIKRHIVSASVADAIALVCTHPARVHSNKLQIRDGIVVGWDEQNMLHNQNKHLHTRVVLAEASEDKHSTWKVILGDTRHDAAMLPGDTVVRVRMRGKHGNDSAYLRDSFAPSADSAAYDLVLRTESLTPVVNLLRWLLMAPTAQPSAS